jgi:hypothetical protein
MRGKITTLILIHFFYTYGFGQRVSDIAAELDKINREIIITYNLQGNKFDKYEIQIFLSENGGKSYDTEPLTYVNGNVGKAVSAGLDRKIRWRYLIEIPDFKGKNVMFKIKARLDLDEYRARMRKKAGPGAIVNSLAFPGWGDYKVRDGNNFWYIGAAAYTLVGSGTFLHFRARQNYKDYQNPLINNPEIAKELLNRSQKQNNASKFLIGAGAAIWLADMVGVFLKGNKNKQINSYFQSNKNKTAFEFKVAPNSSLPGLALQFKF